VAEVNLETRQYRSYARGDAFDTYLSRTYWHQKTFLRVSASNVDKLWYL
jgi:hypothetical protein